MKDKTITARVCDFCPDDCAEFEISEYKNTLYGTDGTVFCHREYSCQNAQFCEQIHKVLETRQKAEQAREDGQIYIMMDAEPGASFHGEVWERCPYCGFAFEAMGAHMEPYGNGGLTYTCERCGKKMRTRKAEGE